MAPDSGGELTITPSGELIGLVRGPRTRTRGQTIVALLRERPTTLEDSLALVYQRPELLDAPTHQTPTLAEIRADFPNVIIALLNIELDRVIKKFASAHPGYPAIRREIEEEKSASLRAGISERIKDMEYLLKILIEAGNNWLLSADDYRRTVTLHEFYGDLRDYLYEGRIRLSFQEDKQLTAIGQRLLHKRRDYEFHGQEVTPRTEDEAFKRELAQLILVANVADLRLESGSDRTVVRADFQKSLAVMLARWPTKALELRLRFGNLLGTKDLEHWAPPPPGALTDRDELADILGTA